MLKWFHHYHNYIWKIIKISLDLTSLWVQKLVVDQLWNRKTIFWVFRKTTQDEVFYLGRGRLAPWKIDILLYYLYDILFIPYLKGNSSKSQLIGQNSNVPNINFVIILLFLSYFRRRVKRGATKSISEERRMDSPSKITNFDNILW